MMDEIFDMNVSDQKLDVWREVNENLHRVFPTSDELKIILHNATSSGYKVENVFSKEYLPYYVRDNKWLAKFVRQFYYQLKKEANLEKLKKGKLPEAFQDIDLEIAEKYVSKSFRFNKKRNSFERKLIRETIKTQTLNAQVYSPVAVREEVLNKVANTYNIDAFSAGVEMEKNNAWRLYLYKRNFEKYLKENFNVTLLKTDDAAMLASKNPEMSADYNLAKDMALHCYQNFGERKYFQSCKGARDCAYEIEGIGLEQINLIGRREEVLSEEEAKIINKRIDALSHILAESIKECEKWLEQHKGQGVQK